MFVKVISQALKRLSWGQRHVDYSIVESEKDSDWWAIRVEFTADRQHIVFKKLLKGAIADIESNHY